MVYWIHFFISSDYVSPLYFARSFLITYTHGGWKVHRNGEKYRDLNGVIRIISERANK